MAHRQQRWQVLGVQESNTFTEPPPESGIPDQSLANDLGEISGSQLAA
jgi:hypothetical protein